MDTRDQAIKQIAFETAKFKNNPKTPGALNGRINSQNSMNP